MKPKIYLEIRSKPDGAGRQTVMARWWSHNIGYYRNETGWKGQIFHGRIEELFKDREIIYGNPESEQLKMF
ncbi:MAG: hypothetical protein K9J21_07230 [Bacteroidales bacterium]|nr:hypothetical protein [Bacteroidales bacterium]